MSDRIGPELRSKMVEHLRQVRTDLREQLDFLCRDGVEMWADHGSGKVFITESECAKLRERVADVDRLIEQKSRP
jgi:hypothetical protein